jgi:hypothetical protein
VIGTLPLRPNQSVQLKKHINKIIKIKKIKNVLEIFGIFYSYWLNYYYNSTSEPNSKFQYMHCSLKALTQEKINLLYNMLSKIVQDMESSSNNLM